MIKKALLFLALFSGVQTWAMEPQPAQSERQVPTLQSLCSKVLLKNSAALQSLFILEKRNFLQQFFSQFCAQPTACALGDSNSVNYLGGYRFLTPGAIRDTVLNKTCQLTQQESIILNNDVLHINGTLAEHDGDSITLHLWDQSGTTAQTCEISAQNLIDSYSNCCFITTDDEGEIETLWYKKQDNVCEEVGVLVHCYECIECAKVFFLLEDDTLRILDKKTCMLEVVQLRRDDKLRPINFCHYDKKIAVFYRDKNRKDGVLKVFNCDTCAEEAAYPYSFENAYCDLLLPYDMAQCICSDDGTAQLYDLKNKKCLATFKARCKYEYVRAHQKPCVVVAPTSEEESAQLWDLTCRECVYTFDPAWRYQNVCHDNIIFSHANQVIAWNATKQEMVLVLSEHGQDQEHPIQMFSYDRYLIVSDAQHLKIWDMALQKCVHTMPSGNFEIYTHNHILEVNHHDGTCSALALHVLESLELELDRLSDKQIDYVLSVLFALEAMLDATLSGDFIELFAQEQYKKLPVLIQHLIFGYFEAQAARKNLNIALVNDQSDIYCLGKKQ